MIEATGADIRYGGNEAFYRSGEDFIQVPYRHQFEWAEAFYETSSTNCVIGQRSGSASIGARPRTPTPSANWSPKSARASSWANSDCRRR